jgi:hypothetical protein
VYVELGIKQLALYQIHMRISIKNCSSQLTVELHITKRKLEERKKN